MSNVFLTFSAFSLLRMNLNSLMIYEWEKQSRHILICANIRFMGYTKQLNFFRRKSLENSLRKFRESS